MRVLAIAATAGLILLAGCDDQTEPSAPPTAQDALTTVTATPTPPPDDVDVTTDADPTTAEPTTDEPTAGDGPPEMPAEAQELTEAGAEAFALHYVNLLNYTGVNPQVGLLEPLAAEDCRSCANYEDSVAYNVGQGDYLVGDTFILHSPFTVFTEETARVSVPVEQVPQAFLRNGEEIDRTVPSGNGNLILRLVWNDVWQVSEITVEQ